MKFKLVAAALLAGTSIASAADLPARTYSKAPIVSPAYNWSGFYVGLQGGYAWQADTTNATAAGGFGDLKGGFVGGTIGYNFMASPNWLLGIEAEGAWADINQTIGVLPILGAKDTVRGFGSVSGRLGYVSGPILIYGKGGVAFGSNKLEVTVLNVTASDTQTHVGFVAGGGVEYMFAPNWSVKGEYLYTSFGSENYFNGVLRSGDVSFHTVKGGINYHF